VHAWWYDLEASWLARYSLDCTFWAAEVRGSTYCWWREGIDKQELARRPAAFLSPELKNEHRLCFSEQRSKK
jgi:hypothetical protein